MGSLIGAMLSSFLLAVIASFVSFYLGPTWAPMTFYLALFLILLFRPQGLLGKKADG
jgi:branched-chain amino acid transport system permease protein